VIVGISKGPKAQRTALQAGYNPLHSTALSMQIHIIFFVNVHNSLFNYDHTSEQANVEATESINGVFFFCARDEINKIIRSNRVYQWRCNVLNISL
jgi:hypothetical protein